MLPTFIPPGMSRNTPWSERDVFQRLAEDQLTREWTIYHSLLIYPIIRTVRSYAKRLRMRSADFAATVYPPKISSFLATREV